MDRESLKVIRRKCGSWLCPHCKPHKSMIAKSMLYANMERFKHPQLLTLTLKPSAYIDASDAYNKVRADKYIPRLLRYLKIKNWVSVMEFQENGMPHWHILMDISCCPAVWVKKHHNGKIEVSHEKEEGFHYVAHWVDYQKLHKLWSEKWQLGTHATVSKVHKALTPRYAVNYILKYLFKSPKQGYPDWVWAAENLKIFTHSMSIDSNSYKLEYEKKAVKDEKLESKKADLADDSADEEDMRKDRSCNRERVASCGSDFVVFAYDGSYVDTFTGFDSQILRSITDYGGKEPFKRSKSNKLLMTREMYGLFCDLESNQEFQDLKFLFRRRKMENLGIYAEAPF